MGSTRKAIAVLASLAIVMTFSFTGTAAAASQPYTAGSSITRSGKSVQSTTSSTAEPSIPSKYNTGYIHENGIDVSQWQGELTQSDWNKIKAAGYDFAIVRVGYRGSGSKGTLAYDPYFSKNIKRAYAAGLNVGVYFFSQALTTTEAKAEADYMYKLLKNNNCLSRVTLPMFMDYEYTSGRFSSRTLSKSTATKNAVAFMKEIKAKGGTPGFYANKSFLTSQVSAGTVDNYGDIWLAHYTTNAAASSYSGNYRYWQWTSSGKISGLSSYSGSLDMDAGYLCGLKYSTGTTSSITVKWTKVPGAKNYSVYIYDRYNYGKPLKYVTTTKTSCVMTGLSGGREYYFKIRANYSNPNNTKRNLSAGYVQGHTVLRYTKKAVVTPEKIYLKTGASQSTSTGKLITKGTSLNVIALAYDRSMNKWYHVSYTTGGKTYKGYIRSNYVNVYSYGKAKKSVTVRSGAGTSYDAVVTIPKGKTFRLYKTVNGWYKVKITTGGKNYSGYVPVSSLTTL